MRSRASSAVFAMTMPPADARTRTTSRISSDHRKPATSSACVSVVIPGLSCAALSPHPSSVGA